MQSIKQRHIYLIAFHLEIVVFSRGCALVFLNCARTSQRLTLTSHGHVWRPGDASFRCMGSKDLFTLQVLQRDAPVSQTNNPNVSITCASAWGKAPEWTALICVRGQFVCWDVGGRDTAFLSGQAGRYGECRVPFVRG